jgi:eukaryotic-like serine/threonine-protein kinase
MKQAERLHTTLAGKYLIERVIGTGGIGVVYAATHRLTREQVAVKFLREENLHDADLKRRFVKEAQAAANLRHPNVVRLIDLDEDGDHGLYMVLELLSGETLQELLARECCIALPALCEMLFPIMHAVSAAHEHGILHRDLKPANIFLHRDRRGRLVPKLLDFGIARVFRVESSMPTRTGDVLGTPDHMSPEQAFGDKSLGPATDVWSMAVVVYRALTGVGPFARKDVIATMLDVASAKYPALDVAYPELPDAPALQAVLGRALALDAARRTPDILALMTELARVARVDPATILARHGLEWPRVSHVAVEPPANTQAETSEGASDDSKEVGSSHVARKRAGNHTRMLVVLLLLAAICALGAYFAFRADEPGPVAAP